MIPKQVEEAIKKEVMRKPNVVGYSREIMRKVVKGNVTSEPCVTIYVTKKLPPSMLRPEDVVPKEIMGLKTDVVEVGEIKLLSVDKRRKFRPVLMGVSVGNFAITAGTIGWMFEKGGETYLGSNAHVLCDDPTKDPKEIKERRIVQPGRYDGGTVEDVIGEYAWHKRIVPIGAESSCPIANALAAMYNTLAKAFKARTRLVPVVEAINNVDFAIARVNVPCELKFLDFDVKDYLFVGLGFAGSDQASCVCKAEYIEKEGYEPVNADTTRVEVGDVVEKSGRTTCHTRATVLSPSITVKVMMDPFKYAIFEDVILTEKLLEPGDSGSSVWVRK